MNGHVDEDNMEVDSDESPELQNGNINLNGQVDENKMEIESTNTLKIKDSILEDFRKLTKDKEKIRTKAGAHLVKYLLENDEVETELRYALGRLIRGIGSPTVTARCGFYSTLVPLLNYSKITVKEIFEHINKELHTGKSNSKSENADICTGKILVCAAIIRSDLFMKSSETDQKQVLECLMNSGKERSYLLYLSFQILMDLVEKFKESEFKTLILQLIQPELEKPLSEYNLDSLYLLLTLRNKYPKSISKILKKSIGDSEIVNKKNIESLVNILLNIPKITAINHPVYRLFSQVLTTSTLTTQFFKQIDGALAKYNKNKHLVVTSFLTLILENIKNPNDIPSLLGDNLIRQTLTVFRQLRGNEKDNELKQQTHKLFNAISDVLKKDNVKEETKISVLKKLLFSPGTFIFEKITKSTLIQQITSSLKTDGVKKLGEIYREVILLENEKFNMDTLHTFQNNDRLYAAYLLMKLLSHSEMQNESEWKSEQLKFVMRLGLTKQPKVGVELAGSLKEAFFRSLDVKLTILDEVTKILSEIFNDLDSLLNKNNLESALRSPVLPETYEIWCKSRNLIRKIESKKKKKVNLVFQILFLHLGLQLFNDVKLAHDALEELFICYEKVKQGKNEENENDPAWIEVVVELFLSLLSHNSHILRKVIDCVFRHLCPYLNGTAVQQILSVLDPNAKNNPLSNKNDSSDDDSDVSDEEEGDAESSEESEESSEDEDMEESNTDLLRKALHSALMENDTGDRSDLDLEDIEEEHGQKLNKVLGNVFKQFHPNLGKSKKQDKNEETLTHFRARVLDLIEIYLDSNPSMMLTLEIMLPLLQTLEYCIKDEHQKPLENRLKSCLKKLSNLKNFENKSEVTHEVLLNLLRSLLEKGTKSNSMIQFMGDEIAQSVTFILKCSQILINDESTPKKVRKHLKCDVVDVVKGTLDAYIKKRDCYIPFVLFKQILQMSWDGNFQLVHYLTNSVFEIDVKPFKKTQGVQLLNTFYCNHRLLSGTQEATKEEVITITKEFLDKCQDFFVEMVGNPENSNVKERFISSLFSLLATIKNSPLKFEDFDWKNLGEEIKKYRSCLKLSQDTKRSFNKLCNAFEISNIVQSKNSTIKLGNS